MSKNGCFRASQSGDVGKRQKLGRRRKVIKEQERWGTGTRNRPIIIHDRVIILLLEVSVMIGESR